MTDPVAAPAPPTDPNPAPAPAPAPSDDGGEPAAPAEPSASPAGEPGSEPAAPAAAAVPPAAPPATKTPWFKQRIDSLTVQVHKTRDELDAAKQENAMLRAGQPQPAGAAPQPAAPSALPLPTDPQQLQHLVQQEAANLVAQQQFTQRCNDVFDKGIKDVPGFKEAVDNFQMVIVGGLAKAPAFVEAVTLLPDGHKVLAHLGQNLEEAQRVMSLPPVHQAMELTRLSNRLAAAPTITRAPAPLTPVQPGAQPIAGPDDQGNFNDQESFRKYKERTFKKR